MQLEDVFWKVDSKFRTMANLAIELASASLFLKPMNTLQTTVVFVYDNLSFFLMHFFKGVDSEYKFKIFIKKFEYQNRWFNIIYFGSFSYIFCK